MHLQSLIGRLKILKHILSVIIWSIIALYSLIMTATNIPFIQDKIANSVASAISQKLGTHVEIGNVDLGFLNRVIIDDVLILDQRHKQMLSVSRMSVKIEWAPLLQGHISIASAQLFGAHANLYKNDEKSPTNFQFVIDSLASKDTTSNSSINLRINSFIVRHSSIRYDQKDIAKEHRFNPKHLFVNNISAHVILKNLTNDSLNINVKRLSFRERSGFELSSLSLMANMGLHGARMDKFSINLPESVLSIDSLTAHYDAEHWKETLKYNMKDLSFKITLNDLSSFFPSLKDHSDVIELNTTCKGTYSSINIPSIDISASNHLIEMKGNGLAEELNEECPVWKADIQNLSMTSTAIKILQSEIKGIPELVNNLDGLNLRGTLEGNDKGTKLVKCSAKFGIGKIDIDFQLDKVNAFKSHLQANDFNLQKLLDSPELGLLSTKIDISGTSKALTAIGKVSRIDFKDYPYQDIEINATLKSDDLFNGGNQHMTAIGFLKIVDENVLAHAQGRWEKNGKSNSITAQGSIKKLSPKDLNLSTNWGDAIFNADFSTNVSASNLNDMQGHVDIKDFVMEDSVDQFCINKFQLTSGFNEDKHYIKLQGDMGSIDLQGQFNMNTLPQSFINAIGKRLPTLPGLPKLDDSIGNDFIIAVNLNSSEWLNRLLYIPLEIEQPLTLNANINDSIREFNITGNLDNFSYDGAAYNDAKIHVISMEDSMKCDVSVKKLMDDGTAMDVQCKLNAYDNQLLSSLIWNNHAKGIDYMEGELNSITQLYSDDHGKPEAHLHFQPSNLSIGHAKWDVMPSDIFYSDKNLIVDNFSIQHNKQHLKINGTASSLVQDTITVDLTGIEIGYILDLVNFHSVEFDGFATGKAYATQLFGTPAAWTNLTVDEFHFENGHMGTLFANARWNNQMNQIDINARIDDGPTVQTNITGYVSPVREDIDLNIHGEGTHIGFLQTYTEGIMKDISGHAYGTLRLVGPLGEMDLLGKLYVDGKATVNALGTTYTLKKDTVDFVRDDILFNNAVIFDKYDNTAKIKGGIHHKNLSDMTFDLEFETNRLLAYDFKDFGDELFCGSVVTAGKVDMHGRPGEVVINCNATPLRPSTFIYNASSSGSVSTQEYITWRDKSIVETNPQQQKDNEIIDMPSDLFINFQVNATPEATMRLLMDQHTNDYITLNGSGIINATYHNKGAFNMFGTYRVNRGTYGLTIQNIIKKNFRFNDGGTIIFGGNPMNATLNLQAIYTVNGVSLSDLNIGNSFSSNTVRVNCLMNILGQAGSPRLEFDLDMPNVNSEEKQMIRSVITNEQEMNQQVLYLLGVGRFYTQGINNASSQPYDQTQLAMQSFLSGTLSSQINEVISQVVKNENWNFGANISTGNEGWNNAEYEGIISGRMLNNRLLINGQFGYRDNAANATPSFIGDFDIRYLLQPNGNLALKVYNQTNDRYFTKSSLNTQGIGIIIKRDFDSLGELFFRRKNDKE